MLSIDHQIRRGFSPRPRHSSNFGSVPRAKRESTIVRNCLKYLKAKLTPPPPGEGGEGRPRLSEALTFRNRFVKPILEQHSNTSLRHCRQSFGINNVPFKVEGKTRAGREWCNLGQRQSATTTRMSAVLLTMHQTCESVPGPSRNLSITARRAPRLYFGKPRRRSCLSHIDHVRDYFRACLYAARSRHSSAGNTRAEALK